MKKSKRESGPEAYKRWGKEHGHYPLGTDAYWTDRMVREAYLAGYRAGRRSKIGWI